MGLFTTCYLPRGSQQSRLTFVHVYTSWYSTFTCTRNCSPGLLSYPAGFLFPREENNHPALNTTRATLSPTQQVPLAFTIRRIVDGTRASMPAHDHKSSSTTLQTLPEDVLLHLCDFIQPHALLSLSLASNFWAIFCLNNVWPRRIASCLGVRAVRFVRPASYKTQLTTTPDPQVCFRILHTFTICPSARTLCLCVHVTPSDTLTSLALNYAISRHDICRANSLYAEHHVAARTYLYIPLPTDAHIRRITGKPACAHTPLLVRDNSLSNKLFPVVD